MSSLEIAGPGKTLVHYGLLVVHQKPPPVKLENGCLGCLGYLDLVEGLHLQ